MIIDTSTSRPIDTTASYQRKILTEVEQIHDLVFIKQITTNFIKNFQELINFCKLIVTDFLFNCNNGN